MSSEDLYNELSQIIALKKIRLKYTNIILEDLGLFPTLIDIMYMFNDKASYKAAWVFELVCEDSIDLIVPHLDKFVENLRKFKFDSAIRPVSKVCTFIIKAHYDIHTHPLQNKLSPKHKTLLIEACFDWLISEQKVAVKVYAMEALFLLGKEYDWIHPELVLTIQHDLPNQSPAYKARAKHVLKRIEKL